MYVVRGDFVATSDRVQAWAKGGVQQRRFVGVRVRVGVTGLGLRVV